MDAKLLTEAGWKAVVVKNKVKDNGLQRALATYEKLDDKKYDDRLKGIATVILLAGNLKKVKEVVALSVVVKYLTDAGLAAEAERRKITTDKATAEKSQATAAKADAAKTVAAKPAAAPPTAKPGLPGAPLDKKALEEARLKLGKPLLAGVQRVLSGGGKALEWICTVKDPQSKLPVPGLLVAPKVGPAHKQILTKVVGSKRFMSGTCLMEAGKFTFVVTTGTGSPALAALLRKSIQFFTGKSLAVRARGAKETAAHESGPAEDASGAGAEGAGAGQQAGKAGPAAAPQPVAPPALGKGVLDKAPAVWHSTRGIVDTNINELKKAIQAAYADSHPELLQSINQNMAKLDGILGKLDTKLADSLTKANAANGAARQAELKNSKAILTDYIKYVKSEPLIAKIDANPFGVNTQLKKVLIDSLTHMAQAIS